VELFTPSHTGSIQAPTGLMGPRMVRKAAMLLLALIGLTFPTYLVAGGPRHVAGIGFFDPGVMGQPVHWSGGEVRYFVD